MLSSTFKVKLAVATAIAGLLTATPALAAAGHGSPGLIHYNGHAGLRAGYVTTDRDPAAIVTDNKDPETMAMARGSRDGATAA